MDEQIKEAIQDVKSAVGYAYYQGFTDLRYDPVGILEREIERLNNLVDTLKPKPNTVVKWL